MASAYRLAFAASAERELKRLPAAVIARIVARIDALATNPRPPGCKKLVGGVKVAHPHWGLSRDLYHRR